MINRFYLFLGLSLLVHLAFWSSALFFPEPAFKPTNTQPLFIEIREANLRKPASKQIVRAANPPDEIKSELSNEDVIFLSENDQRVKKQQRAAETGMTQNRVLNSSPNPISKTSEFGLNPASKNSIDEMLQSGISTVGESLPQEVAIGSFTALNTDRFTYYSFFSRVEQLIRFRWESRIRSAIQRFSREQLQAVVRSKHLTQIEVVINLKGEVEKIILIKSSGIKNFDEAPANAFWEARVLNNPPAQLADKESKIKLQYSFKVEIPTMPMAQTE